MGERVQCFWLEPSGDQNVYLRRYTDTRTSECPRGYHSAMNLRERVQEIIEPGEHGPVNRTTELYEKPAQDDPGWPTVCAHCGEPFAPEAPFQLFTERIWRRGDTGEEYEEDQIPAGGMYDAWWYPWKGLDDGRSVVVRMPGGGLWCVDSQASNCTRPGDRSHRCWLRHGEPPHFTVNKEPRELTCDAGGGSIETKHWHGFLTDGWLVPV